MLPPTPAAVDLSPERMDALLLKMMHESALDTHHIRQMRLRLATPDELEEAGRPNTKVKVARIPYFDIHGNEVNFRRYRYLEDPRNAWERMVTDVKGKRYFQPAGTGLHAYFPPMVDWEAIASGNGTLLITEGEKKAASACAHGFPCIGLGGVDCFASKKDDSLLLPELLDFKWEGRDVVIVYDSDASDNPSVLAASIRLGRRLFALNAKPRIAKLPATRDGKKQGIDDLIYAATQDGVNPAAALTAVVSAADQDLFERELALYDFNSQFVYIRDMDRVIVRDDGVMLQPDAFINRAYASKQHREMKVDKKGNQIFVPVKTAQAWMEWEERLDAKRLDFAPGVGEFYNGCYNLWRGWPLAPVEGDASLWVELLDKLFSESPDCDRRWFEQWCAYPVQNPGAKLKTAVLLWSYAEGTGKSTVLECLRAIYGTLYIPMNDSAVDMQYTDWMVNKLLVGVDDIAAKNREDHAAKWRNLITSPRLTIQKKYTPTFEIDSRVNFIMTSNEGNALRIPPTDRRYFIQRVAEWADRPTRTAFFDRLYKWLENGGAANLMHYLLSVDMTGFDPDAPAPTTESKLEMQEMSRGPVERWVVALKDDPDGVLRVGNTVLKGDLWTAEDLLELYNSQPSVKSPVSLVTMSLALASLSFPKFRDGRQIRAGSKKPRLVVVRNLDKWASATAEAGKEHYMATRMK